MVISQEEHLKELAKGYRFDWKDDPHYVFQPKKGLSREVVEEISHLKGEPDWMRKFRLKSLEHFERRPMPWWGADLSDIDFQDIYYFIRSTEKQAGSWDELPEDIKGTWDKLGIPEAEKKYLGGVSAQYECLRGSTQVWTTSGMRPIKSLVAGDRVFALNEASGELEATEVRAAASSGEKEVFEITARGRVIGASANHPFLVLRDERRDGNQRARYRRRWLPVEELAVGDLVAVATDTPDFGEPAKLMAPEGGERLPTETSDDLAWWVGLYLGDGYLHDRSGHLSVEIAVRPDDCELIAEIVRVSKDLFGLEFSLASDGLRLTARGTRVLAEYILLNGLGGTAHSKRMPDWVFGLPASQRLAFLGGFVDADGYVRSHARNHDVVITSASESLLSDLRELAHLSGIGSSRVVRFTSRHPFDVTRSITGHRLFLSGRFDRIGCRSPRRTERLGARAYGHGYRTAKGTTFKRHTSEMFGFVRVEDIRSVGVEPVYDIEVDRHSNFVAEGFIVHNSEVVYHKIKKELDEIGVLFTDMDTALKEHPDIVREHFGTLIPPNDNKFAALNSAVWSGGSFIYVPPGVQVDIPLQAYFRINAENMGQFERTLIVADEGSYVHYVEGCSAPIYSSDSLHSAVVEIKAMKGARVRYTTIQNWSTNVYNLVTKRAAAYEDAVMEWVDGNIGSKVTMKYPSIYLLGQGARGEVLSVAYAGKGMHTDAGGKAIHAAPHTTSVITSKSVSKDGGRTGYRGLVRVEPDAHHAKSTVRCDALILDDMSRSDTYPYIEVEDETAALGHEATVSKVGDDQLFYLRSRGLSEVEATAMIVNGFIEPITRELPMEYAVELNRLVELQMEGSVG
jgi:Fe-S cluster assembly protein SufB